jgi:hypothetical protein
MMIFEIIYASFSFVFSAIYKTLNQYLVYNFLLFIRGFEFAIVLMAAILFFLIAASITMRKARKLPNAYEIRILDLDGRDAAIDGLRVLFSTYDAAESFAIEYGKTYANQYKFKVIGKTMHYRSTPSLSG